MTYEHSSGSGYPASLDVEVPDIDCPEGHIEQGCVLVNGLRCVMLDEQGYCGMVEHERKQSGI